MRKQHQLNTIQASMVVVLAVQNAQRCDKDFTMSEVTAQLHSDYGIPEKTGFRYVRQAIDVLGIFYDTYSPGRMHKRAIRSEEGVRDARRMRNGQCGRAA